MKKKIRLIEKHRSCREFRKFIKELNKNGYQIFFINIYFNMKQLIEMIGFA